MKTILVTQRIVYDSVSSEVRDVLDVRWTRFLHAVGCRIVPFSTGEDFQSIFEAVKPAGVILSGGNDLASVNPTELSKARDRSEQSILRLAVQKKFPVFGVCRGLQVIGHYFSSDIVPVEGHVGRHDVQIDAGSTRFFTHYKKEANVNSYHNFGMSEVKAPLQCVARARDGFVEALEHEELPIAAVMWHPEREECFSDDDIELMRKVFLI